jgi:hypothetical protein
MVFLKDKKKNKNFIEIVNVIRLNAKLTYYLCYEALHTTGHIYNKVSSKNLHVSPHKVWMVENKI